MANSVRNVNRQHPFATCAKELSHCFCVFQGQRVVAGVVNLLQILELVLQVDAVLDVLVAGGVEVPRGVRLLDVLQRHLRDRRGGELAELLRHRYLPLAVHHQQRQLGLVLRRLAGRNLYLRDRYLELRLQPQPSHFRLSLLTHLARVALLQHVIRRSATH